MSARAAAQETLLRPFDPAEIPIVAAWMPDEEAAVRWGGPGVHWPVDAGQFQQMLADPWRTCWSFTAGGRLAGHIQIYEDRRCRSARLGRVAIAPALRGQGLAAPMLRHAVDLAFTRDPDLHRMELQVYVGNAQARAAYARAGFSQEGMLRESVPVETASGTVFWTTVLMGLLRAEWSAGASAARG